MFRLKVAGGVLLAGSSVACAQAQLVATGSGQAISNYPTKPIRVIVPSSPGGGLDFVSRAVGQQLTAAWGQTVVVDNRAGAGGTLGPELVARAAPDGYTLMLVSATFAVNPSAYDKLPYDTHKDFAPITQATTQPQVMVVHPSIAARTLKEFIALAKAKPGQLNYASPGDGTLSQLAFELFKMTAGVNVVQIPYKGAGASVTAAVAGEVQASSGSAVTMSPHVVSGRLRAIASTGKRRSTALPEVPTMAEQGLAEATITGWYAFLAPAGARRAKTQRRDYAHPAHQPDARHPRARRQ
jgi:tripartite-type tricarboxylate transporter receptor subunit TctC